MKLDIMTTSTGQEIHIRQEPLPVPAMDDVAQIPSFSSEDESFVVIRSAADLDELLENDLFDGSRISMLQENNQLVQEELVLSGIVNKNKPSTSKESLESNTTDQHVLNNPKDSFQSTIGSLPNGLGPLKTANDEMNQSCLPQLPQPRQIYLASGTTEDDYCAMSMVSFSPNDFCSGEIQAKVSQLIDENMQLKDIIIQNNEIMKAQYDRKMAWQNDVTKVHEAHKEAKKCIETLKEENATIKQENQNLRYNMQIQQTEHDKTEKLRTSENDLKEFALDKANKKITELEVEIKNVNLKIRENQASQKEKTEEHENLALQIDQLKATIQRTSEDALKDQEAFAETVAELSRLNEELESKNSTILTQYTRIKKLEEELEKANNAVEEYRKAVQTLQEKEEQAAVSATQKMTELQQNTEPARPQYPPDYKPGELSYLSQQLMLSQKALAESEQNRAVSDDELRMLNNEVAQLRQQLQNLQTESADHFALKAQLDVYKADFETEREAKKEAERMKTEMAEDLQHLRRRNQQLLEEIERGQIEPNSNVPTVRQEFTRRQATAPSDPSTDEFIYRCPKCNFGFKTLRAIEDHVVLCIELDLFHQY